jgi:hypothetical protein
MPNPPPPASAERERHHFHHDGKAMFTTNMGRSDRQVVGVVVEGLQHDQSTTPLFHNDESPEREIERDRKGSKQK